MEKNISQEKRIEELEARLKEQEKLGSLGLLSAGIAHEIQNPLNFVINFSKLSGQLLADLADRVDEAKARIPEAELEDIKDILSGLRENVDKIKEHGDRAISIIRGILLYSRGKEDEFMPTQIQKLTKEYVWLAYHAMRANYKNFNIAIRYSITRLLRHRYHWLPERRKCKPGTAMRCPSPDFRKEAESYALLYRPATQQSG